jgi:hypothetical protein
MDYYKSNSCVMKFRKYYTTHIKFEYLVALTLVQTEKKIICLVTAISFNIALNERVPWTRLHDEKQVYSVLHTH